MKKFMFEIPNDPEGEYFIYLINKFLNKETYTMRKRARGPRAKYAKKDGFGPRGYDQYLPLKYAERFQLYFDSGIQNEMLEYLRNKYQQNLRVGERLQRQLDDNAEGLSKLRRIKHILREE